MIAILVNGKPLDLPEGTTAAGVVEQLGLAGRPLAVEVNAEVVPRAALAEQTLAEGDRVEIVTLVGGG